MGIKRCPSFSKRPGFPCGLRVLLVEGDKTACAKAESLLKECSYTVTTCSTAAEALNRLTSGCSFDVLLADTSLVSCKTHDGQQLLDCSKGLPCILMAQDPSPEDIMAGIQLGAVDFLAKPLSPLKLQNIWQHTVRKMMGNMNINCSADVSQLSAPVAPAVVALAKKELAEMEVILEEPEKEQQAAAAEAAANSNCAAPPAKPVIVVDIAANMALATASSLYKPTRCISRTSSSMATETSFALASPGSPIQGPAGGANKLHKSRHAPVHSCPSTRSLNSMSSMSSCYSTLQLAVPPTPGSPASSDCADASHDKDMMTTAAPTSSVSPAPVQQQHQQRCIKKAIRHTPATPASKPPLASKPQAAAATAAAAQNAQQAPSAAPMGPGCGATAAGPLPMATGLTSVPLPTGLGPLPQGMVWGMPMCPLARAPGIVPPNSGASSSSSQAAVGAAMMPPMSAWGMCGMPMGMPMGMPGMAGAPYMSGMMMSPMAMAMPFGAYGAAGSMGGYGMPGSSSYDASSQQQLAASGMPLQDAAAAAAAPVAVLPIPPQKQQQQQGSADAPTGAAMAAALNASLGGLDGAPESTAAAATLDVGDAFDFMLGEIAAEDDLDVDMSGLLDGELTALEKDGLKLPAELQELQALEQQQQQYRQQQMQQRASFDCSNRLSFDCHGRQRVSFDCSTASTTTGARVSFECSAASRAGLSSQRVSFEVNCNSTAKRGGMAAPALGSTGCGNSSDALLGSMSDLFAAGSGDSCSEGSGGMTHVDSCGMLADLQSLFAADGCPGTKDDGCSGAAGSASLFDDVMDDLPLELALKKSSSLAELLNAGLNPMQV